MILQVNLQLLYHHAQYLKDSEYKDCIHVSQQEIDLDDEVSIDIEEGIKCIYTCTNLCMYYISCSHIKCYSYRESRTLETYTNEDASKGIYMYVYHSNVEITQ